VIDIAGFTAKVKLREAATPLLSVAVSCTVTGLAVLAVGVPVMAPEALPIERPAGSPVWDQV
jgi:hypothetical protein